MSKYPSDWKYYIRYDLPISWRWFWLRQRLFQLWCYQDGFDYVGFTLLGFSFAATRKYFENPLIKPTDNLIFSWLVTHFTIDINPIGGN